MLGVIAHTCNPRTRETNTEGSLQVQDQLDLWGKFNASYCYIARLCLFLKITYNVGNRFFRKYWKTF